MRNLKPILITAIATATAIVLLIVSMQTSLPSVEAQIIGPNTISCITFTKDGDAIGERICSPAQANDIHISFRGKCEMQFTVDGEKAGKPIDCPRDANDFSLKWDTRGGTITGFEWSKNGRDMGGVPVPEKANDFYFKADKIVVFLWTVDGQRFGDPIPAPAGANDAEFDVVVLPR